MYSFNCTVVGVACKREISYDIYLICVTVFNYITFKGDSFQLTLHGAQHYYTSILTIFVVKQTSCALSQ